MKIFFFRKEKRYCYSPNKINCTFFISIKSPFLTSKNQKLLQQIEALKKTNQSRPNRAKSVQEQGARAYAYSKSVVENRHRLFTIFTNCTLKSCHFFLLFFPVFENPFFVHPIPRISSRDSHTYPILPIKGPGRL